MIALEIKKSNSLLEYNHIDSESAIKAAAQNGELAVFPEPNELFLDIDNVIAEDNFPARFLRFQELIDDHALVVSNNPSRSGADHHRHIIVRLADPLTNKDRILFQLMLGSDPFRELLSYVRDTEDDPHPTLFVEREIKQLTVGEQSMAAPESNYLTDADIPY